MAYKKMAKGSVFIKASADKQGPRGKKQSNVYVVILIGGKGKRLRPLSTAEKPKAFLSVTKDRKTMFQRTVARASNIVPLERILVVANKAHASRIKKDLPGLCEGNILLEPVSRNTAPAIALAAHNVKKLSGDHVMVVLPTDQYLIDEERYLKALEIGIDFVRHHKEPIVIFGQKPSYPATGFGYIRVKGPAFAKASADKQGSRDKGIVKVERFTEKPDLETAKKYLDSGRYLWNISTFIFKADVILRAFKDFSPVIYHGLSGKITPGSYAKLPDISVDYAIMEHARNIHCVKGDYGWQDMGSFDSLRDILEREGRKFVEHGGKITKII